MSTTPTEILETTAATLETVLETIGATEPSIALDPTAATEAALDIESIKEIMDAFDPAALLPEMGSIFDNLALVCRVAVLAGPVVLLILGLAYLFLSPKEANYYFGYRCYFGMGSIHAWRFTQRIAGALLGLLGLILTGVMLFITGSFSQMEVMDMVWKSVYCLAWEAGLALTATIAINLTAMFFFDRKGEYRRKNRRKKTK